MQITGLIYASLAILLLDFTGLGARPSVKSSIGNHRTAIKSVARMKIAGTSAAKATPPKTASKIAPKTTLKTVSKISLLNKDDKKSRSNATETSSGIRGQSRKKSGRKLGRTARTRKRKIADMKRTSRINSAKKMLANLAQQVNILPDLQTSIKPMLTERISQHLDAQFPPPKNLYHKQSSYGTGYGYSSSTYAANEYESLENERALLQSEKKESKEESTENAASFLVSSAEDEEAVNDESAHTEDDEGSENAKSEADEEVPDESKIVQSSDSKEVVKDKDEEKTSGEKSDEHKETPKETTEKTEKSKEEVPVDKEVEETSKKPAEKAKKVLRKSVPFDA